MSIEAKVHAPTASFPERALVYGLAGILFALGLAATSAFPIASTLLAAGLWIWLVSSFLLQRRRARAATIEIGAGSIRVRQKHRIPRTIRTRMLEGASVARNGEGAVVTINERGSAAPVAIEVSSLEAANEIRSALGIPHGGFGEISWSVHPKPIDIVLTFMRAVAAVSLLLVFALMQASVGFGAALLVPAIFASILAIVLAFTRLFIAGRTLHMRSPGIFVSGGEAVHLPFAEMSEIVDDQKALLFRRKPASPGLVVPCAPTRWLPSGLTAEERTLMIAQLRGALAASKGEVAPFVDPTSHLDALKRKDASAMDWLARLDALASMHANAAYRSATIAKEDLWRALESHDAGAELRAGAARVLLRISPEKEQDRIARAIDSIHDDDERAHIRAALRDDVEEAAAELEETEQRIDASRR